MDNGCDDSGDSGDDPVRPDGGKNNGSGAVAARKGPRPEDRPGDDENSNEDEDDADVDEDGDGRPSNAARGERRLRFSIDDEDLPPDNSHLQRMPSALFASVAEYCWVDDLRSAAAASKRMHLAVKGLRWKCEMCPPDRREGGSGFVFADGLSGEDVPAGNCPRCLRRMCDSHARSMHRGTDGCRHCRWGGADCDEYCRDCARDHLEAEGLFECDGCSSVCCNGGRCDNFHRVIEECNGDGCDKKLCENCYRRGIWDINSCDVEDCQNTNFCSGCAKTHLVDHRANEDVCFGSGYEQYENLCMECLPQVACSGPCGRGLCSSCAVEPECPRCDSLTIDARTKWASCRCFSIHDPRNYDCETFRAERVLITRPEGSVWTPKFPIRCLSCFANSP